MKRTSRFLGLPIGVLALALSFALRASAESPREEIVHAYFLLKKADHDYAGHRVAALKEVEAAGRGLGLELHGDILERERRWKSDQQLKEARRLLADARDKLEERDRVRLAGHVERAIKEIDVALAPPVVPPAVIPPVVPVEEPREEIIHAFRLLKRADHDYGGHRVVAMKEVEAAGRGLGLAFGGDNILDRERQWKSDQQLKEARRLLADARNRLEQRDRVRLADHVEKAIREIDAALLVR